jgi:hypothetical protein
MTNQNNFISLTDAAKYLDVGVFALREHYNIGDIDGVSIDGVLFFPKEDVEIFKEKILSKEIIISQKNKVISLPKDYLSSTTDENAIKVILDKFYDQILSEGDVLTIIYYFSFKVAEAKSDKTQSLKFLLDCLIPVPTQRILDICATIDISLSKTHNDFLGALYTSICKCINVYKESDYYISKKNLIKIISKLEPKSNDKILIPLCKTGRVVIEMVKQGIDINNIYGIESDPNSMIITKINVFLYTPLILTSIFSHFINKNCLVCDLGIPFDYVFANFLETNEIKSDIDNIARLVGNNINDLSIYEIYFKTLNRYTKESGKIIYCVSNDFCYEKDFVNERLFLEENNKLVNAFFINGFKGSSTIELAILITINSKTENFFENALIEANDTNTLIEKRNPGIWLLKTLDIDYFLIVKIAYDLNRTVLHDKALFGTGIITGNNERYLTYDKENSMEIYSSKDIFRYHIEHTTSLITLEFNEFKYVAPKEVIESKEKIIYRSFSDGLVFAYDDKQRYTLNTANFFIPKLKGYYTKFILGILNSSVITYYYKHLYDTNKVLKSQIEKIPIPVVSNKIQSNVVKLVEYLESLENLEDRIKVYEELDDFIMDLYGIDLYERNQIRMDIKGNYYL